VLLLAPGITAFALSQTLLLPSLPRIADALNATPSAVSSLMTAFSAAGAVTVVMLGRLGDMFGKRRLLLVTLTIFTVGSVLCALSTSLGTMIVGRIFMGCCIAVFPLSFSLVHEELPISWVATSIATLSALVSVGGAIGQSLGGVVADLVGYRAVFWISVGMGVFALGCAAFVPESKIRLRGRVDFVGMLLLAGGLAAPLIAIEKVPENGWVSGRTLLVFAVGAAILTAFVAYERRYPSPLIDLSTLSNPRIRMTNIVTFFVGFGTIALAVPLIQFFQEPESTGYGLGATATQAGLFLVPGLILGGITTPISGRLSARVGPLFTLRLGTAVAALGVAGVALGHSGRLEMYVWPALTYVGMGATFGALPMIILQSTPSGQGAESTGVNIVLRNMGFAIGVQFAATLITSSEVAGVPTESGYTAAFAVLAGASALSFVLALFVPAVPSRALAREVVTEAETA
jgi:MFS family permease